MEGFLLLQSPQQHQIRLPAHLQASQSENDVSQQLFSYICSQKRWHHRKGGSSVTQCSYSHIPNNKTHSSPHHSSSFYVSIFCKRHRSSLWRLRQRWHLTLGSGYVRRCSRILAWVVWWVTGTWRGILNFRNLNSTRFTQLRDMVLFHTGMVFSICMQSSGDHFEHKENKPLLPSLS